MILFLWNQSCRRIDMHSKRPSILTVVPFVLGLSNIATAPPKSENTLLVPDPESSDEESTVRFLDNFTSE